MLGDRSEQDIVERELGARYQIVRVLGRGASGAVYLARERQLHRMVAIKVLRAEHAWSEAERARLRHEARTIANLSHPAIVPLLAFDETTDSAFMVMPYVGGETLADRLHQEQRLDPSEARRILIEIADALAYAHGEGVLHRDIKPENILLERVGAAGDDRPPRVRLLDFGIAAFPGRDLGISGTRENALRSSGTTHFMSPEQALGETELDGRSDLFALGALGYLMLAGQVPFDGPSRAAIIARICAGERVPLKVAAPEAPVELVAAIDKCLEPNPAERWRRASGLREALGGGARASSGVFDPLSLVSQRWGRSRGGRRGSASRSHARVGRRSRGSERVAAEMQAVRGSRIPRALAGLSGDVRFAVRTLGKTPGFTAAVVLTLALGLAATTAVFSAVEALVLRKPPVADPASLVVLQEKHTGTYRIDGGAIATPYHRYLAYRQATGSVLTGLGAQALQPFSVRVGDQARSSIGLVTSGNYFELLGVRPVLGRFYTAAEDRPGGAEPVAVVGYDFWQRTLGGDPKAVGQTLVVDSRPLTIVGVAPRGFHGAFLGTFAFNVWVPAAAYRQPSGAAIGTNAPREIWMNLFGRLRPGVDSARASAALRVIAPRVPTADPDTHVVDAWVDPLTAQPVQMRRSVETFMAMLLTVAVIVLLIAAANAAAMLIARAAARRREVATRLAVGASRPQLVRQLLVESVLLCVAAGTVGLLLTWWLMRVLNAWQPPFPVPVAAGFSLNVVVLAVAAAIMLGTGLLSGLAPALYATRVDLAAAMKEGGLRGGTHRTRLRSMFVVAQVALSVVLLAVAGLFVRSLERTLSIDPGFAAAGVVHAGVNLEAHGYDEERAHALFTQLLDRLRARPDVAMAALATNAPLSGHYSNSLATRPDRPDDQEIAVQWGTAGVGFIELLRTPLLAGRAFTRADGPGSSPVAVINETLAQRLWPGESPRQVIGHELRSLGRRMTVVGVIGNGKYTRMQEEATGFGYISLAQNFSLSPMLYVRARGTTAAAFRAMREELARLAPNVALDRPSLLTDDIGRDLVSQRIGALLVGTFGLVGLVLATTGLYGVLAFGVAQRQREFGVRIALGARISHVVRLVVRHGLTLVAVGIALGLIGTLVAARLVSGFLYGVSPADPLTLVAVPLVLLAVALLASIIPARRAAAADPMTSLRAE